MTSLWSTVPFFQSLHLWSSLHGPLFIHIVNSLIAWLRGQNGTSAFHLLRMALSVAMATMLLITVGYTWCLNKPTQCLCVGMYS